MAMKRMMKMNILNSGKKQDEGRYRGDENRGRTGDYDRAHNDHRYDREFEHGEMRRGNYDDMNWDEKGRHKSYDNREDERYEGGGGRYAGNFRHRENSGKHETGEHDEDEVEFDEHAAKKWVAGMLNNDGTTGEHFKPEIADQLRATLCPGCEKNEFWTAMNMMYSDYCDVLKKLNVDRPEAYAHMARAFLMDKDAGEGKLAKYMKYVAGK